MEYFSATRTDPSRSGSRPLSLSLTKKRKLSATFNEEGLPRRSEAAPPSSNSPLSVSESPLRSPDTPSNKLTNTGEWKDDDDDCIMLDNDDDDQFWNNVVNITDVYANEKTVKKEECDTETYANIKQEKDAEDDEDEEVALMKSLSVSQSDVPGRRPESRDDDDLPAIKKEEPDIGFSPMETNIKQEEVEEDPFMQSSPPTSKPEPLTPKRKGVGEDVFTESCVKEWQGSRIKAWEGRYLNPEGYYYRFVVPGEGQQNGGWSKKEHALFMERYNEWISRGWKIGASWGLFSRGIPHRVGYQCMNYYRKLVSENKLKDDSYAMVDGKLKQIHKERAPSGEIPTTELGPEWESDEVKEVERNVDKWLKQYHKRSGMPSSARPAATPKKSAAPRVAKTTTPKRTSNISDLVKKQPPRRKIIFIDDEDTLDGDALMEGAEPEQANLRIEKIDWEKDWRERLEKFKEFMKPFLDPVARRQYWLAKQEWRRGLATTEMLLTKKPIKNPSPAPAEEKPSMRMHQTSLAVYYKGIKARKIDTPDELVSNVRIPNELFSGVHQIKTLASRASEIVNQDRYHYFDVDNMLECVDILDVILGTQEEDSKQPALSPLEGILVDPPWEFYVEDGRNDGRCSLNIKDMMTLMEKVVSKMTAGLIFIWTHKLIQADVVHMMHSLDCKYVENLVWFKKSINNVPLDQPSPYFSSAKEILLMFKKGDGFELRHQRTADVIIDFEKPRSQWIREEFTEPKPEGVYDMIETLLPCAGFNETLSRGRLLELWAKKSSPRREGWISFHQNKPVLSTYSYDSQIPSQSQQPSFVS